MALINCIECKGKVSEIAEACPTCGAPVTSEVKEIAAASASSNVLASLLFFGGILWLVFTAYIEGSDAFVEQLVTVKWVIGAGFLFYLVSELERNLRVRKLAKKRAK